MMDKEMKLLRDNINKVRPIHVRRVVYSGIKKALEGIGITTFTEGENPPGLPYLRIECEPEDHKWLYYNYERYCGVCKRIEPYWDKIRKACNPVLQANSIVKKTTRFKPSDVLGDREIRRLPVIFDSEGNIKLIMEVSDDGRT